MIVKFILQLHDKLLLPNGRFNYDTPNTIYILLKNIKSNVVLNCIAGRLSGKKPYKNFNENIEQLMINKITKAIVHESVHMWLYKNISQIACKKYDDIKDY